MLHDRLEEIREKVPDVQRAVGGPAFQLSCGGYIICLAFLEVYGVRQTKAGMPVLLDKTNPSSFFPSLLWRFSTSIITSQAI